MAAQHLSPKNPFFLYTVLGQTTTDRNFSPKTKNEIDSETIYKNKGKIVGFFRNFDFSKNVNFNGRKLVSTEKSVNFNLSIKFYDIHFIFIYNIFLESFSFFCFRLLTCDWQWFDPQIRDACSVEHADHLYLHVTLLS